MPPAMQDGAATLSLYPGLENLPSEALRLFDSEADFSLSREWFENMVANGLPCGAQACFGVLRADNRAIAAIPLQRTRDHRLEGFTNYYTHLYRPLIAVDAPLSETAQRLGQALARFCGRQPVCRIDCLPPDWAGLDAFIAGVRSGGRAVRRFDHFGNWYEPMQNRCWTEYLATRPGNLRELLRRRQRQLARAEGIAFEIIDRGDDLARGIAAYETVYARSWKPGEPFPRFNSGLMQQAAGRGVLRLGICWQHDRPIAAQLWITVDGRATVMKLAHDENDRALSPGTLLTAVVIQRLIKEGVAEIDFGRGDDPYKRLWARQRRQRIGLLLILPWRLRGLLTLGRHDLGRCLKAVRPIAPATQI
jgi:hypothetical protein